VRFSRYKAFREFSLALDSFNILVGPNNSGKSTILSAFRILSEAIRRARARSVTLVSGPEGQTRGYDVSLRDIPVAAENIFHNYDDDLPASIRFRISTGDHLLLFFPKRGACNLICETSGRSITTPSSFNQRFTLDIGFVPVLGPVEHDEPLYQREAARDALLTHRASRNFRNIWYHYPDSFDDFRALIQATWPGMDIKRPEVDRSHDKTLLRMFCPEERIDREIFWAGFGFQVWCQMLTFIVRYRGASLLIVDEPDIYLHSDLQRQLVTTLRTLGPDILLATHSTEMISEAEPNEILVVTKRAQSAKRVGNPSQLQSIFSALGSHLTPTLSQLARTRRVVYFEGKDFHIVGRFAARLNIRAVATRSDFAVVPTEGFNPLKARMFTEGVEATLGVKIAAAAIFDRDYRSDEEVDTELTDLRRFCSYAHIHSRKEVENFLLVPTALERAISKKLEEQNQRTSGHSTFSDNLERLLRDLTDPMKHDVQAQFLKRRHPFLKSLNRAIDEATITSQLLAVFDEKWTSLQTRIELVPGKEVLSRLNSRLQEACGISITPTLIIDAMTESEVPEEIRLLVQSLDNFAKGSVA
jgi:energy-coupling factor transporter ATP-binding protein EcfA2